MILIIKRIGVPLPVPMRKFVRRGWRHAMITLNKGNYMEALAELKSSPSLQTVPGDDVRQFMWLVFLELFASESKELRIHKYCIPRRHRRPALGGKLNENLNHPRPPESGQF